MPKEKRNSIHLTGDDSLHEYLSEQGSLISEIFRYPLFDWRDRKFNEMYYYA